MRIKEELRRLGKAAEPAVYSGLAAASRKAVELRAWTEKRIRDHMARHSQPEMVYLCVPGWDTEEDIRDAVRSARIIYESGKIPVCPYMMFPNTFMDSAQNRADSMKMRFRLLDICQSVLICGQQWTDEMWAEVHHAIRRGKEIRTNQDAGSGRDFRLRVPAVRGLPWAA